MSGSFDQNHRLTPLEKCIFFDHSKMTFLSSKKTSTHFEKITSSDEKPRSLLQKKEAWKKFGIFNQNHWLTLLEKCKFFDYSKMTFMWSKKPPFGKTTSSDDKKEVSLIPKSRLERHWEFFYQNHGLTPLEKCKFFYYSKRKVLARIVMILWNVLYIFCTDPATDIYQGMPALGCHERT